MVSPCSSLLLLAVLVATASSIPGPTGDWKAQSTSSKLEAAFRRQDGRSFDEDPLLALCNARRAPAALYLKAPREFDEDTDFGPTISSALATVAALGGGTVRLSVGVFPLQTPVILPSLVCLAGAGPGGTVLSAVGMKGLSRRHGGNGDGLVQARKASNVTIAHLTIDAGYSRAKAARVGVALLLVNFAIIADVHVQNTQSAGVLVTGLGYRWAYHVRIEDVTVQGSLGDGITIMQTYYTSILRTIVRGSGNHALILAQAAMYADIRSLLLTDSGRGTKSGCGLMIRPAHDRIAPRQIIMSDSRIVDAYRAGACFRQTIGADIFLERVSIINGRDESAACYALDAGTFNNTDPVCHVLSNSTYVVEDKNKDPRSWNALPIPQARGQGCMQGLLFGDVCCPIGCPFCGGKGCGALADDGACCASEIRDMGRVCGVDGPPCVVQVGVNDDARDMVKAYV